jgi:hypothetical protein
MVRIRYRQLGLGEPERPTAEKWIHLVPVAGRLPDEYSLLSQQWALAYFCIICAWRLTGAVRCIQHSSVLSVSWVDGESWRGLGPDLIF